MWSNPRSIGSITQKIPSRPRNDTSYSSNRSESRLVFQRQAITQPENISIIMDRIWILQSTKSATVAELLRIEVSVTLKVQATTG